MSAFDKIIKLSDQLLPKGRAFKMPINSYMLSLNRALAFSEERAYLDATAILGSILPDTSKFTVEDARDWERRLGLITNEAVSLSDRKLAIERKINHPGDIPARQHYLYIQRQLRAAGFDVYVYENRFPTYPSGYAPVNPSSIASPSGAGDVTAQHGDFQHGDLQHGVYFQDKVVNHIDEAQDNFFDVGPDLTATFFISGNVAGKFTNVPLARKEEFRQLILKLKPVQMVAFLFINYV